LIPPRRTYRTYQYAVLFDPSVLQYDSFRFPNEGLRLVSKRFLKVINKAVRAHAVI
jgi:hypothetical protein